MDKKSLSKKKVSITKVSLFADKFTVFMALFPLIFFLILFAAVGIPLILYYTGVIGDKNNDDPIPFKSTTTYSGKTNDVLPSAPDTTTTTNQVQIKPVLVV